MPDEDEGLGEKLSDSYQELVRSKGDEVLIHTQTCVEWKMEHKNCKGCRSSLGCCKSISLMLIAMTPMMYKPNSFEDYERMNQSVEDKMDRILEAKTDDEVKAVRI